MARSLPLCPALSHPKRIKQWTFYRRDEARIAQIKRALQSAL